jgi:hypothetical protein
MPASGYDKTKLLQPHPRTIPAKGICAEMAPLT